MENIDEIKTINEELTGLFQEHVHDIRKNSPEFINAKREEAFADFKKLGLPSQNIEEYRYMDFGKLFKGNYTQLYEPQKLTVDFSSLFKCNVPELDSYIIVLVNGRYYRSDLKFKFPKGVLIGGLSQLSKEHPEIMETYYNKYAGSENNGLAALNTAFAQDGLFIYIPKNTEIEKPIQIINILVYEKDFMVHPRNFIMADDSSSAKIVVCDHTLTPWKYLTNSVTEIILGNNARLDIYNIQDENNSSAHINSVFVNQSSGSAFVSNIASIHGGTIRNNIHVTLDGERSEANIFGLYLTDRKQHIDNFTFVDHAKPNCVSSQLYKGVLDDEATGAFNGKILVRKDAQNTNAFQKNNNVLLTNEARMNTKPQLEIYADDVKCSHGATVGQINEDALFYMRSRGISEKEARLMLMYAFAFEVIGKINFAPLQERITDLVDKRLRGELSRCSNCVVNCR
ncbi:MAG: Fe-S cluster assembly protein SufD [Bacteroidia bacterium]|nr:Fe-S cluster assembly protein SufD [Bacteroidia bacterium]